MRVRLRSLPTQWQNAALCRLPPGLMDELQAVPGDLLQVEDDEGQKQAYVRVFVRTLNLATTDFQPGLPGESLPEIEVDPGLMNYLEIQENHPARISRINRKEAPIISAITFASTEGLPPDDEKKLQDTIRSANWPVYPEATFAVNLSGRPVILKTLNTFSRPGVIQEDTVISLRTGSDLETLRLEQEILAHEVMLEQLQRQRRLIDAEYAAARKILQEVQDEETLLNGHLGQLDAERTALASQTGGLNQKEAEYNEQLAELRTEGAALDRDLKELEEWSPPEFDLEETRTKKDEAGKNWQELLKKLEDFVHGPQ